MAVSVSWGGVLGVGVLTTTAPPFRVCIQAPDFQNSHIYISCSIAVPTHVIISFPVHGFLPLHVVNIGLSIAVVTYIITIIVNTSDIAGSCSQLLFFLL